MRYAIRLTGRAGTALGVNACVETTQQNSPPPNRANKSSEQNCCTMHQIPLSSPRANKPLIVGHHAES